MEEQIEVYERDLLHGLQFGFKNYVHRRQEMESARLSGNGLPDYALALDYELRKKLDAIPHLYSIGKNICGTVAGRYMHECSMNGLLVGPDQFCDVYEIGCDCARRLGIGIPNIYIKNNQSINACTIATDDVEPVIIVNSGLYERFTLDELRFVIGHECGHIHNQHTIYNMLGVILLQVGLGTLSGMISTQLLSLLTLSSQVALNAWSRAAEVTCDRAGMICSSSVEDAYRVNAKFTYGAALGEHSVNIEALKQQFEETRGGIARFDELFYDHPIAARRIAAAMEFAQCEVFYRWRPEFKEPGTIMRSKAETDERCRRYVAVSEKG